MEIKKLKYSTEGQILIKCLKEFDEVDFEKWYADNLEIGSRTLFEYIFEKNKSKIVKP